MWAQKIGLDPAHDGNPALLDALFSIFGQTEIDMSLFFRGLSRVPTAPDTSEKDRLQPIQAALYEPTLPPTARAALLDWLARWAARARLEGRTDKDRQAAMDAQNPRYVLRNYLAQLAIDDLSVDPPEAADPGRLLELLDVLRHPYTDQPGKEHLAARRPDWAKTRPGCAMLSCSS